MGLSLALLHRRHSRGPANSRGQRFLETRILKQLVAAGHAARNTDAGTWDLPGTGRKHVAGAGGTRKVASTAGSRVLARRIRSDMVKEQGQTGSFARPRGPVRRLSRLRAAATLP